MSEIIVYAELLNNEVTEISRQCLTMARLWADKNEKKLGCIVVGSGITPLTDELSSYGADIIYLVDDPKFKEYLATPYKKVVGNIIKENPPQFILMPSSTQGNDLAAAISTNLGIGCVLDCHSLDFDGNELVVKRLEFDRKVLTGFAAKDNLSMVVTVKDGVFEAGTPDLSKTAEIKNIDALLDSTEILSKVLKQEIGKRTVNLNASKVIVTAGAGIGSKDNYKLVEDLASALGGEVGATRPVVDAGWASVDRQIGQTGATVKPDVYIACGVSGAVQHKVGMMDAKTIVAINTDASAPIFKIANYCIVGDIKTTIPKLLGLIK